MHPRIPSTTLLLVAVLLLVGLLAGCGGGGQTGDGSQEGAEKQGQAVKNGGAAEQKIAIGTVMTAKPDKSKIVLRPAEELQGGKRITFKVLKEAKITLGDKEAEMADVKKGQQAQIQYTIKNGVNRAQSVQLFETGGG